ncbi:MAG: cytochrome c maturation protein CcmE [Candidatus Neomarinimicrobiota bacterium]
MKSNNKFKIMLIGVVLVVAGWIGWVSSNPENDKAMVAFVSVSELLEEGIQDRTKLGGIVKPGSIIISESNLLDCSFILEEGDTELPVKYHRTRPDLFKDGAEVIVSGVYTEGVFVADDLQTKCASRYEGDLRDGESYNLEELES